MNHFSTLAVHAGEEPDKETGAIAPVLVRSKTFHQPVFGEEGTWQYSRGKNPTRQKLEEKLVALEGGGEAAVFSSGVAAEAMVFFSLRPGDHVLCCKEVYGGTYRLLTGLLDRFGIASDYIDLTSAEEIKKHIRSTTKYLWVETPTNPSLHVIDLRIIDKVSKETGVPWIADATFSPPCALRAFEYGAETVVHSLSKYIAGHNDVLGGAVITRNKQLAEHLRFCQRTIGAILSPDECYRVLQGVKTLELRWQRVSESALKVAEYLQGHGKIKRVLYPGLPNHSGHEIAKEQSKGGFGGVLSFETYEDNFLLLKKFVDALTTDHTIIYGESLASPETILAYPPLMSHKSLPKDTRLSLGISDSFFRLSLGFEDVEDIIAKLEDGLRQL